MANIGDLKVWVQFDDRALRSSIRKVKSDMKNMWETARKENQKTAKSYGSLWRAIAWALSIGAIIWFTKQLLTLWSSLEETQSKFDTVFGGISKKMNEDFENIARTVWRSSMELKSFGATIGDLLNPLWFNQEAVGELSKEIVKLWVDLASFNNVSDDQAINALTKGLLGEREALKSLGIAINETEVKQKAMNLWLYNGKGLISAQAKALATYELYLKKTKKAQWDAVRTGASFENMLKRLKGTIKDTFAKAGQDVARDTAWILQTLDVFVQKYWAAIMQAFIELWWAFKSVFSWMSSIVNDFASIFWMEIGESVNWLEVFGDAIMILFNVLGAWVRGVSFMLSSFIKLVIGVGKDMVNSFSWAFKIVGSLFGALWNVAKVVGEGIANNIIAGIINMVSGAIDKINEFIRKAESLLGVSIGKLSPVAKRSYVDLVSASKGAFDKVAKSSNDFTSSFWENTAKAFWEVKNNFYNMGAEIIKSNNKVKSKLKHNNDIVKGDYKTTFTSIGDIMKMAWDSWWAMGDAIGKGAWKWWKAWKKMWKEFEKAMKVIEKSYDKMKDKNKDWVDASEKYKEEIKWFNDEIESSLRWIRNEIRWLQNEYVDAVNEINNTRYEDINSNLDDFLRTQVENQVEIEKSIKEQKEEIKKLNEEYEWWDMDRKDFLENQKELNKELLELNQKLLDVKLNIKEATNGEGESLVGLLEEERKRAEMSEERRAAYDFKKQQEKVNKEADLNIELEKKKLEESKKRLEQQQKIYTFFREKNLKNEEQLNELMKTAQFERLETEEQNLILKLARDKFKLEEQKRQMIAMQREVAWATINLSNEVHRVLMENTNAMSNKYRALVREIQSAIVKQRELNAIRRSQWFAGWWYTWDGGVNDIAWVVHKGEYVVPQWMVKQNRDLIRSLENMRWRWYSDGWYVSKKVQNNTINNYGAWDYWSNFDKLKWKL